MTSPQVKFDVIIGQFIVIIYFLRRISNASCAFTTMSNLRTTI